MERLFTQYEQFILRPPRQDDYNLDELCAAEFSVGGRPYVRTDHQVKNKRGETILYSVVDSAEPQPGRPVVLYCHSNASCRVAAQPLVYWLLMQGISLVTLDFPGCGKSDGDFISLGHFEQDSIEVVLLDALAGHVHFGPVVLWGRSMGAASIIMLMRRNLKMVRCVVLDSPFASLPRLARDLATQPGALPVPRALATVFLKAGMSILRKRIMKKANFDLMDVEPIAGAPQVMVPALFVACEDELVPRDHSTDLEEAWGGPTARVDVDGGHNDSRPLIYYETAAQFLHKHLGLPGRPLSIKKPHIGYYLAEVHYFAPEEKEELTEPYEPRSVFPSGLVYFVLQEYNVRMDCVFDTFSVPLPLEEFRSFTLLNSYLLRFELREVGSSILLNSTQAQTVYQALSDTIQRRVAEQLSDGSKLMERLKDAAIIMVRRHPELTPPDLREILRASLLPEDQPNITVPEHVEDAIHIVVQRVLPEMPQLTPRELHRESVTL